jgi:hypothetical protein
MNNLALIIQKPAKSNSDMDYIRTFLSKIPFFSTILTEFKDDESLVYQLFDSLKYMEFPSKTLLIKQGSKTAGELFILI